MNIKKLIIIVIICIILLITLLFLILKLNLNKQVPENIIFRETTEEEYEEYLNNTEFEKINNLKDHQTFFTVLSCINKYIQYNEQKDFQNMYNVLSEEYISENNITINDIEQKVKMYNNAETFTVKEIYEYNNNENVSTYFIYGKTIEDNFDNDDPKQEELNIVVQLDKSNRTFDIILNETKEQSKIAKKTDLKEIKNKSANVYVTANNVQEQQIGLMYLSDYKDNMLKNVDKAYEQLNKEYKQKRYSTIEEFKKYINSNTELMYITGVQCEVTTQDETNIYTVEDQYGKKYIFKETAIMEYTVELDDYTIEKDEFIQKYESSKNQDKGIMNIDKFFEMINMQDYASAYNLLDESFRETNFKTQADFKNFVNQYMFRYNKVKYKTYSDQIGSLLIYGITLTDSTKESDKEVNCNIIMKLLEDTNFVMSFEIVQ